MVWKPAVPCSMLLRAGEGHIKKRPKSEEQFTQGTKEAGTDPEQWAELDSSTQHFKTQLVRSVEQADFSHVFSEVKDPLPWS